MRVLHLAAGNRWTGAAAPAFAEVQALREAGVDAHYAYVGGYKLQAKIGHFDYAHPIIEKAQNPFSFKRTTDAIDRFVHRHGFDVLHAHLTWDHWLARMIAGDHGIRLARTYHSVRSMRSDPLSRHLLRKTDLVFVVNDTFRESPLVAGRAPLFTPPPLDTSQFQPGEDELRAVYAIPPDAPLVTVIGKLSKGRGFEEALQTFAELKKRIAGIRMMIIGHGEHRPVLEQLAVSLGVHPDVTWAGYHEADLTEHYRASDVLLFTARGSDEGHRAVLEAMACGVAPATYPIDGIHALLANEAKHCIAPRSTPESLADTVEAMLTGELATRKQAAVGRAAEFSYRRAADRLLGTYSVIVGR